MREFNGVYTNGLAVGDAVTLDSRPAWYWKIPSFIRRRFPLWLVRIVAAEKPREFLITKVYTGRLEVR